MIHKNLVRVKFSKFGNFVQYKSNAKGATLSFESLQEFYDELNARNKAAAEEALAKYEEEEREKLAAIADEQKALEISEGAILPAVTESEDETKVEIESDFKVEIESEANLEIVPDSGSSPAVVLVSSEPEFPKADFSANSSIIVAATLDEQEAESEKENVEEQGSEEKEVEKS
jgi:hypothetical protein